MQRDMLLGTEEGLKLQVDTSRALFSMEMFLEKINDLRIEVNV